MQYELDIVRDLVMILKLISFYNVKIHLKMETIAH